MYAYGSTHTQKMIYAAYNMLKTFKRPQDFLNGTWNEVSKTNIDEILKKMGYNWAIRKVANVMGMTLVIKGTSSLFRYNDSPKINDLFLNLVLDPVNLSDSLVFM